MTTRDPTTAPDKTAGPLAPRRPGRRAGALWGALAGAAWAALAASPAQAAGLAVSESTDVDPRLAVLTLLIAGPLVYAWIHLRYRNKHARHHYESETEVKVESMVATDNLIARRRGTRDSKLPGANAGKTRGNAVDSALGVFEEMVSKQVGDGQ
jgi:hypothetical protein